VSLDKVFADFINEYINILYRVAELLYSEKDTCCCRCVGEEIEEEIEPDHCGGGDMCCGDSQDEDEAQAAQQRGTQ